MGNVPWLEIRVDEKVSRETFNYLQIKINKDDCIKRIPRNWEFDCIITLLQSFQHLGGTVPVSYKGLCGERGLR